MIVKQIDRMAAVDAESWNRLVRREDPCISHEFLSALEESGCVGVETGWRPRHLLAYRGDRLIAAMPLYLKDHSRGEYVFDQQWAEAYARCGMTYYPKWVNAVPFTPCPGQRILVAGDVDAEAVTKLFLDRISRDSERMNLSSLHCLFPESDQIRFLQPRLMLREGVQFQWRNRGYRDFADYLQHFTSRQRKNVNKERRNIRRQGIELVRLKGEDIEPFHWRTFFHFYQMTYWKNGHRPYLNEDFFNRLARTMPDRLLLVLALKGVEPVAAALNLIGGDTLYGRYWGCERDYAGLHFEACYYQGLEFCMENSLQLFDSGAQGEHKISRGFEPVTTYSAHWIQNSRFARLIDDYLHQERVWMKEYRQECETYLPFKQGFPN